MKASLPKFEPEQISSRDTNFKDILTDYPIAKSSNKYEHGFDFLDTGTEIVENYDMFQRDLDEAMIKAEALQSKKDFLRKRLQTYKSKIQDAEEFIRLNGVSENDISEERLATMKDKIQTVQDIYQQIEGELSVHQKKIQSMRHRQLELKIMHRESKVLFHELLCASRSRNTNVVSNNNGDDEISELELIENTANNTNNSMSLRDEHRYSPNFDVESARVNDDEEEMILTSGTAKDSAASFSIPVGADSEVT